MLNQIRAHSISYEWDDYKTLLNLQCGVDQSNKDEIRSGEGQPVGAPAGDDRSRKLYNMHLIELFALDNSS